MLTTNSHVKLFVKNKNTNVTVGKLKNIYFFLFKWCFASYIQLSPNTTDSIITSLPLEIKGREILLKQNLENY